MAWNDIIFCIVTAVVMIVIAVCGLYERKTKIVPAPTLPHIRKIMIAALGKHLPAGGDISIAELGSGWGGLLFALAKKFPQARLYGYELSFFPYGISRLRFWLSRKNITLRKKNFFEIDLGGFDAVVCYLSPYHMKELQPQFKTQLKNGAIVISNAFAIPGWTPLEILQGGLWPKISVYVYKKV